MIANRLYLLPFVIVVLAMGFQGLFHGFHQPTATSGAGQPVFLRMVVYGSAYALSLFLLLRNPLLIIAAGKRQWPYIVFLLLAMFSILWSAIPVKVLINVGHYSGLWLAIICLVCFWKTNDVNPFSLIARLCTLIVLIDLLTAFLLPGLGISQINGRWQGLSGNPNTLGLFAMVGIWALLSENLLHGLTRSSLTIGSAIILLAGLVLAGSMTSILLTGLLFPLLILWAFRPERKGYFFRFRYLIVVWSVSLVFAIVWSFRPELLTIEGSLALIGRNTSFTGRTDLWEQAWQLIAQKPWLGWGMDSNISSLERLTTASKQFHNGYLDLAVRGGIIILVILCMMVFYMILSGVKGIRAGRPAIRYWLVLLLLILIHNLTEASLMRETHFLWLMFLTAYGFLSLYPEHDAHCRNDD